MEILVSNPKKALGIPRLAKFSLRDLRDLQALTKIDETTYRIGEITIRAEGRAAWMAEEEIPAVAPDFEKVLDLPVNLATFLGRSPAAVAGGFRAAWAPPLLAVARKRYVEGDRSPNLIQTLYFLGSFQDSTLSQIPCR